MQDSRFDDSTRGEIPSGYIGVSQDLFLWGNAQAAPDGYVGLVEMRDRQPDSGRWTQEYNQRAAALRDLSDIELIAIVLQRFGMIAATPIDIL